jgi:uracil-DNA glycosylase
MDTEFLKYKPLKLIIMKKEMKDIMLGKLLGDFKKELYEKVIRKVINLDDKKIEKLYNIQRSEKHFKGTESAQPKSVEILADSFNDYKDENINVLGIDLPLWIDWDNKKKQKLMIVGRDPQRNINNVKDEEKRLIIGSPYSLASNGGRVAKNNYWSFIEPLIENHRLYITDIYKLFISNTPDKVKELRRLPIHYEIFKEELNLIQPDIIITFGKDTAVAVKKIIFYNENVSKKIIYEDLVYEVTEIETNRKFTIYFIPHISGQVTNGIKTIANLYKSIGELRNDKELKSAGKNIMEMKNKLLNIKGEAENL